MVMIENYNRLVYLVRNNTIVGCGKCKALFEDEDFAFALGTGECPYCHENLSVGLTNRDLSCMLYKRKYRMPMEQR